MANATKAARVAVNVADGVADKVAALRPTWRWMVARPRLGGFDQNVGARFKFAGMPAITSDGLTFSLSRLWFWRSSLRFGINQHCGTSCYPLWYGCFLSVGGRWRPCPNESALMRTATTIVLVLLASAIIGLLRDAAIASYLGTSISTDVLFLALAVPATLESVFGIATRDAMVHRLCVNNIERDGTFEALESRLVSRALRLGGLLVLLALLVSPWITEFLAPGWSASIHKFAIAPVAIGILLSSFQLWSYVQAAQFNVRGSFLVANLRAPMAGVSTIVAVMLFPGNPAAIVAIVALATFGFVCISANRLRLMHLPMGRSTAAAPGFEPARGVFGALVAAAGLQQLVLVAERLFASFLATGVLTQMAIAFRISSLIVTLIAFAVFSKAFPDMVRAWSTGDFRSYRNFHHRALSLGLLFMIPAAALCACRADVLVSLLFERGAFTALESQSVASMVRIYSAAVPGLMLLQLWSRALVAQGRFGAIVVGSGLALSVTVALDFMMVRSFGASGLVWAFVCGCWVNVLVVGFAIRTTAGLSAGSFVRWMVIAVSSVAALLLIPAVSSRMLSMALGALVVVVVTGSIAAILRELPGVRSTVQKRASR
jgi:putative peptidoglycan lipid II flippase